MSATLLHTTSPLALTDIVGAETRVLSGSILVVDLILDVLVVLVLIVISILLSVLVT